MSRRTAEIEAGLVKTKALRLSLIAISSVFIIEFSGGLVTNSLAVITDSIHALLDAVVTGILIIATTLALKPRDVDHTYGHGKIETIGGFIGGCALFVIAIFFIYEASARIISTGTMSVSFVKPSTFGFAAVFYTLAADGFRIVVLKRAAKKTETEGERQLQSSTLKADLYHAFTDLTSTSIALIALWLETIGVAQADSIAAIALGSLLGYLSARFAYRTAFELTDVISPRLVTKVKEAIGNTEGVLECKDVKMRRVGSETFVEVTVSLRANISFENAHEISAQVEKNIVKSLSADSSSNSNQTYSHRPRVERDESISDTAIQDLKLLPKNITVHFEPSWSPDLPTESLVEKAAIAILGVRGVHNVLVSKISGTDMVNVSLHIQVDRSATLQEAHSIATSVEESIKEKVKGLERVTVHLEPQFQSMKDIEPIVDMQVEDSIRKIILSDQDIKEVNKIALYGVGKDILKIDAQCVFLIGGAMTIDKIHEHVSEIEKQIRTKYPSAVVTIHAEPT